MCVCQGHGLILQTYLEEGINVPNGWDVLWYEWLQFGFQVNSLRSVSCDVLKELLELTAHLEMLKLSWIIHSERSNIITH